MEKPNNFEYIFLQRGESMKEISFLSLYSSLLSLNKEPLCPPPSKKVKDTGEEGVIAPPPIKKYVLTC